MCLHHNCELLVNLPLLPFIHCVHQNISAWRCSPLVKPSQPVLHNSVSNIQTHSQVSPYSPELNFTKTHFSPPTQKNISNPQKIRNTPKHSQTLRACQNSVYRHPVIFWGFLEFFLATVFKLHYDSCKGSIIVPTSSCNLLAAVIVALFPTLVAENFSCSFCL